MAETTEVDPAVAHLPPLSPDQAAAVKRLHEFDKIGEGIILTGPAGSGKSMVVKYLLAKYHNSYTAAATTGAAAMLVGGRTVDSLFSMNRDGWVTRSPGNQETSMMRCAGKIIIDESSAIGCSMANFMQPVAITYEKCLILSGDWRQTVPVNDDPAIESNLFANIEVVRLTENHRQTDEVYLKALNDLSIGAATYDTEMVFKPCVDREPHPDATRIYGRNIDVDDYNKLKVTQHGATVNKSLIRMWATFEKFVPWAVDDSKRCQLIGKANVAHFQPYALGCRVLVTANSSWSAKGFVYVNGDTGVLEDVVYAKHGGANKTYLSDFDTGKLDKKNCEFFMRPWGVIEVKVRLDRTGDMISVEKVTRETVDKFGGPEYVVRGFPVKLGYATTVHKSQGMTLPCVHVDMESLAGMPTREGLAYVALSRTRNLTDLSISAWDYNAIHCPTNVGPFL